MENRKNRLPNPKHQQKRVKKKSMKVNSEVEVALQIDLRFTLLSLNCLGALKLLFLTNENCC